VEKDAIGAPCSHDLEAAVYKRILPLTCYVGSDPPGHGAPTARRRVLSGHASFCPLGEKADAEDGYIDLETAKFLRIAVTGGGKM